MSSHFDTKLQTLPECAGKVLQRPAELEPRPGSVCTRIGYVFAGCMRRRCGFMGTEISRSQVLMSLGILPLLCIIWMFYLIRNAAQCVVSHWTFFEINVQKENHTVGSSAESCFGSCGDESTAHRAVEQLTTVPTLHHAIIPIPKPTYTEPRDILALCDTNKPNHSLFNSTLHPFFLLSLPSPCISPPSSPSSSSPPPTPSKSPHPSNGSSTPPKPTPSLTSTTAPPPRPSSQGAWPTSRPTPASVYPCFSPVLSPLQHSLPPKSIPPPRSQSEDN